MNVIQYQIIDCSHSISFLTHFSQNYCSENLITFLVMNWKLNSKNNLQKQKWFQVLKRRQTIILTLEVKFILRSINCTYYIHIFKKYFEWDNSISDGVWGNQFNSYLHFVRNSLKTREKTWMNSFEMLNKLFIRI